MAESKQPLLLAELLKTQRLTAVVDIGANPIDGAPPYQDMLAAGLCQLTGFEPQADALAELQQGKGPLETYLPLAIGDGKAHTLYRCLASGMTSLLQPSPAHLATFNDFPRLGEVIGQEVIETVQLDQVTEIEDLDFLKIDVQGSELAVFESGKNKLSQCVAVQTEVSFVPLYQDQPLFWQIDRGLRELGFIPHAFAAIKRWPIAPFVHQGDDRRPLNQLLEADIVYVRDFSQAEQMSTEQIKHLALIAHYCYGSHDLCAKCLHLLKQRGSLDDHDLATYFDWIKDGVATSVPTSADLAALSFGVDFTLK